MTPAHTGGDKVLSTFFPNWHPGGPELERETGVPGDHVDGFAAELVAMPAAAFTRMPKGWTYALFDDTATTEIYALSLHAALPLS